MQGTVERGETIVFGYYRQQGIEFDDDMTVIDAVKNIAEKVMISDGTCTFNNPVHELFSFSS